MKQIITIAGGGSTYTPGVVKAILSRYEEFPVKSIRLYDIDSERQNDVSLVVEKVIEEMGYDVELIKTVDPKTAFENADFVFAQIRVGKYKMRELDEKIPLKHGIVGQETCGPGGLAYGMRTIYPMTKIIDYAEKYANENHWILNYSNPASIVAEAMKRLRPNARIINICDMPVAILESFATILNVESKEIHPNYFGLNHFGWFTGIKVNGKDYLTELIRYSQKTGYLTHTPDEQHYEKSWNVTYENMKYITRAYDEFLPNTYLQYYLLSDHVVKQSDPTFTRANEVQDKREKNLFNAVNEIKETGSYNDEAFKVGVHGTFIIDLAISLISNEPGRYLLIVENNGAISNVSYDTMVEVPCYVSKNGIEPTRIGEIPVFHKGLIEQQAASEKLIVDAAIEGSYQKALESFSMNKTVPDTIKAKELLDEMIEANKDYWPILK